MDIKKLIIAAETSAAEGAMGLIGDSVVLAGIAPEIAVAGAVFLGTIGASFIINKYNNKNESGIKNAGASFKEGVLDTISNMLSKQVISAMPMGLFAHLLLNTTSDITVDTAYKGVVGVAKKLSSLVGFGSHHDDNEIVNHNTSHSSLGGVKLATSRLKSLRASEDSPSHNPSALGFK